MEPCSPTQHFVGCAYRSEFRRPRGEHRRFRTDLTPPDTTGAVGLTQYVQWVNTTFTVFDKSTGNMLMSPLNGNALWFGFGGNCESRNHGDPIVNYDKQANAGC